MISQRIAEAYDRIANDFTRINAAMPDTLADCGHLFLSLIGPNAQVLDVGAGPGRRLRRGTASLTSSGGASADTTSSRTRSARARQPGPNDERIARPGGHARHPRDDLRPYHRCGAMISWPAWDQET